MVCSNVVLLVVLQPFMGIVDPIHVMFECPVNPRFPGNGCKHLLLPPGMSPTLSGKLGQGASVLSISGGFKEVGHFFRAFFIHLFVSWAKSARKRSVTMLSVPPKK